MTNDVKFAIIHHMPDEIMIRLGLSPEHEPVAHQVADLNPQSGEHAQLVADRSLAGRAVNGVDPSDPTAQREADQLYIDAHAAVQEYEDNNPNVSGTLE